MDEQLHELLRAWEQAPDPALTDSLIALSRRAGLPLPPELEIVEWAGADFLDRLNACYQVHDAAGYDHLITLEVMRSDDPEHTLQRALSTGAYPCLEVNGERPVEWIDFGQFYGIGYGQGGEPEAHAKARAELVELTADFSDRLRLFPRASCTSIGATFPSDGQVYWHRCDRAQIPELELSLVFCLQYYY